MKRYDIAIEWSEESPDGEWVRFEDVPKWANEDQKSVYAYGVCGPDGFPIAGMALQKKEDAELMWLHDSRQYGRKGYTVNRVVISVVDEDLTSKP